MNLLKTLFLSVATMAVVSANAIKPIEIAVWPDGAPHKSGLEGIAPTGDGNFLTGTNEAVLTIYPAEGIPEKAVLMCPGGGYAGVAMKHEGSDMAGWFNELGVTFAVLQYRMPNGHKEIPLEDAEQAMRIMRDKLPYETKIGVGGASAGGHLAATLANMYSDSITRPDFQILFYPVISMEQDKTHGGSRNNLLGSSPSDADVERYTLSYQVNSNTSPAFIVLSADDKVVLPDNSVDYFNALVRSSVPATMHIYPQGGHGWGFSDISFKPLWQAELESWLKSF